MKKYLFHNLFRLSKEGIMTSCKSIAFFLLVSTQVLFGALNVTESTASMQVHEEGTQKLVSYTDVPGLAPSEFYSIRVKSAATGNAWVPVFTNKTYNRQQELSNSGDPYAEPPVGPIGWSSVPMVSGSSPGHITRTGIRNYLFFTGAWSHSYGNIEMTPGTAVDVEISSVGGFKIRGQDFYKAAVHPQLKAGPVSVVGNKVYFTITNPAQIVIDINGNMDDSNKALVNIYDNSDIRHTVSLFANPIMVKPSLSDTANVVAVEPGTLPSNDLGTKKTLFFKPGVHNLGVNFLIRPGKKYYIPGDAIVYGAFNNIDAAGIGGRPKGEDIKVYGYGTLSGGKTTHPDYVIGAQENRYKTIHIDEAYNVEVNGICIADPAHHSCPLLGWKGNPDPTVTNTFIRWAKVISWRGNGDGFGGAYTEDSFIRTNDDAGYLSGSKYRCTYWKDTAAAVFHMAGIPDNENGSPIVVEDCDLIYSRCRDRVGGSVFDQRGSGVNGLVHIDLTVRNFRIHDKWANRRVFNLNSGGVGTSYSGIKFENISMPAIPAVIAGDPGMKGKIYGRETAPWFGGLMFKNVTIGDVLLSKENFGTYFDTNAFANYFLFDDPRSFTLTTVANNASQGSVTRNLAQATYLEMSAVELTAVSKGGSKFSYWSGGASGTKNPLTVWMTDNKTITANFTPPNFVDPITLDIPNSGGWSVPEGVSSMTIQTWGGGGAGGSAYIEASAVTSQARGGGGAGGSYAGKTLLVQPGDVISYSVGAGGEGAPEGFTHQTPGASGGVSSVQINGATVVSAVGGPGGRNISISNTNVSGSGGLAPQTGNTGDTRFYGGNGISGGASGSGSGGGSAGAEGDGGDALSQTAGGLAGVGGGAVGGAGHNGTDNGRPGGAPGAGGSGAGVRNSTNIYETGGQGGDGKVIFIFNTIRHTLTPTAENGTITVDPPTGPYISGRDVTVTANPELGFAFSSWSGDLSGSVNPTTLKMDGNKNVTANFVSIPTYTLTTVVGNGQVTLNPPGPTYNLGTVVTVAAKPGLGFAFANWSGSLTGSVNSTTITMDGNKSVTANYISTPTHTLTTAGANGSVTLDPLGGTYNPGTVVTVTATPGNGYAFGNWSGDLTGALEQRSITMDGNKSVTANFLQNAEITGLTNWVSGTSNPKVSGNSRLMTVMVMGESSGDFSATGVTYGGQAMIKQSESLFSVTGNRTYAALFTLGESGVTAATSGTIAVNWSTSPSVGSAIYSVLLAGVDQANPVSDAVESALSGTTITTSPLLAGSGDLVVMCGATENDTDITNNNGFTEQFEVGSTWGGATGGSKMGIGANETPSFTQSAAGRMVLCAMVIKRAMPTFSLVTTAGINGEVTLDPPGGIYDQGTVVTATAAPNSGFTFINWSGDLAGSVNSTSFTMNSNRSVTANFAVTTYTLTTAGLNGRVILNPPGGTYTEGTVVTVTAAPNSGFAFSNWSGGLTGSVNPTSVTMNGNLNVTANFTLPTYTLTTAGLNGRVILNPPGGTYTEGTVVTVTAAPDSGFTFSNWSGDLSGSVNPTNVTMSANRSVTAIFGPVGPKTWDGGGANSNWSTVDNWSDNFAPSGPNAISYTFAGNTQNTSNNDLSGLVASDFNFTNNGSVGKTNAFVLSGNTMTVQNISTTASSSVIADTINFNINTSATGIYDINTSHHLTINGNISGGAGLTKNGLGVLTLSGNNNYNGVIAIQQGTIFVSSIADVGSGNPSSIGSGNLRMGNASSGVGTLNYTGSGATTARTVQIGNGAGISGAIILATGANGGTGLKFTAANFNTLDTDATNNARGLTLSGPNTDDNTISGIIQNAKTSGVLNLVKDGNGKWILSGVNTYTGNTTVSAGTLQLSGSGRLNNGNYAGTLAIASGATFQYGGSGNQTLSGVVGTGGGNLSKAGGGDLILTNAANAYGALNISAGRVFINTSSTALPSAATVALTGGSLVFSRPATYGNAITVSSGAGIAARAATSLSNVTLPGSGSVIFNNDDAVTTTLAITKNQIISGALSIQVGGGNATVGTATLSGIISGASGAITKMGTGTLTLSGANTYTGATTISAGTLAMGASNVLPATAVSIGSATLDAATFAGTLGTLDVTGSAIINLGVGAALTFNDSRAIDWSGGTLTITGTFVSGSSLRIGTSSSSLTTTQLSQISKPGGGAVTLDDSGFLIALPAASYPSWASTNASGTTPAQDQDDDGVCNAVEYVLGGNVLTNDLSKLPVISSSGGNILFTFQRAQTSINANTALRIQVGTTLVTWPDNYTVGADTATSSAGVTVLKGVPAGFDTVTLSVPEALDLQKFIRLNVNIMP